MDPKIFAAAAEGNIRALSTEGNRLLELLTPSKNTVLHIYVAHADKRFTRVVFIRQLLRLHRTSMPIDTRWLERIQRALVSQLVSQFPDQVREVFFNSNVLISVGWSKSIVITQLLDICPQLLLQPNDNGDTALHIAARYGLNAIVEDLIRAAKARHQDVERQVQETQQMLRTQNKEGDTALHEAARFNHLGVVKILRREDPDSSYPANFAERTPIYLAAERGYRGLVYEILESCTTQDLRKGPDGKTVLHAAVICSDSEMTQKLLHDHGTLAQAKDDLGWTPLHFAALIGNVWTVRRLLACDRSVAYIADNGDKMTALHIAASKGHKNVVLEIMYHCPDCCEAVDNKKRNILHYAIENRRFEIVDCVQTNPWMSNILLNGKDDEGNTPLHQTIILIQNGEFIPAWLADARVDKMALNKEGLNASDIILKNDHALSALEKIDLLWGLKEKGTRPSHPIKNGARMANNYQVEKDKDAAKEAKSVLLVVATLIATVTFAAGFTVPGGYRSDGSEQGYAVLTRNAAFKAFVVTNTIAMVLSSGTVLGYLIVSLRVALRKQIGWLRLQNQASSIMYAMVAMVVAFITGSYAVLGNSLGLALTASVIGCSLFFIVFLMNVTHAV